MRKSAIAALLSALVFPGAGHFYLRSYARGSALLIVSAAALFEFIRRAWREVEAIRSQLMTQIDVSGVVDLNTLIAHALAAADRIDRQPFTIAMLVLLGCWLIGIIDSHRIGKRIEEAPISP